ncbi:MAG: choice-of-anchor D domain-containing protein [Candidatus Latescibacteria bacterium]|nr:choice-of-anchor D domain-containing protein [Candidatus Latescibacterota bacterium]
MASLSISALAFDNTNVGSTSQKILTVSNTGTQTLSITGIPVMGTDVGQFGVSPTTATIAAGRNQTLTVTFAPTSAGQKSAALAIAHNAPGSPYTVPLSGRGKLPNVTVSADTLVFGQVAVGQTSSQVLTLTNNATGRSPASTLTILTSDTEVPALTVVLAAESGVSAGPPSIAVFPTALSFGSVALGQSKSLTLSVTNEGGSNLRVLNIVSSSGDVTVSKTGFSLAPGGEELLTVTLQPTQLGSFSETLDLPSNDPVHSLLQVSLRATIGTSGGRPSLALDVTQLAFGQVAIGETGEFTLPVRNVGSGSLTISNAVSDNTQVVVSPTTLTVPPQETRSLTVRFRPLPGRERSGRVTLFSNDTAQSQVGVSWSALDVRSPYLEVTALKPADRASGVSTSTELQLTFSEPLFFRRGFTALDAELRPEPLSGLLLDDLQVRGDGRTVVIPVQLARNQVYRLVIYGATGRSGLELFDMVEATFSTGTAPPVLATLSGTVDLEAGQQLDGSVYLFDPAHLLTAQSSVALDGSFELSGVSEGTYNLYVDGNLADGRLASGSYDANGDGLADALQVRAGVNQTGLRITPEVRSSAAPTVSSNLVQVDLDSTAGNQRQTSLGNVQTDQEVVLEIYATQAEQWTGGAVTVAYDTSKVYFAGAEEGENLLRKNGGTALFLSHVDPVALTVEYGGAIMGPTAATAVSGSGLLGRFRFTTLESFSGQTDLQVTHLSLQTLAGKTKVEPNLTVSLSSAAAQESSSGPVSMDFNQATGDQGLRIGGSATVGKQYPMHLHVANAPQIDGWSVTIDYDPIQVRYVSGSFAPSTFIAGLTPLVDERQGRVNVSGAVLVGSGKASGNGMLGTVTFEVLAGFGGRTELVIPQVSFKHVDTGEEILTTHATAIITQEAATGGLAGDFNGDNQVNFSDFFLFADAFGGSDPQYDLSGDGPVNFSDFFLFADAFGSEVRAKLMELAHQYLGLPAGPTLEQNYPNPFNAQTTIPYELPQAGPVRLEVYDLLGQRVRLLVDQTQEAGSHQAIWDGRDGQGQTMASGIYLYRVEAGPFSAVRRLAVVK